MWHLGLDIDQPVDFFYKNNKVSSPNCLHESSVTVPISKTGKKVHSMYISKFKCGSLSTNETEEFEVEIKNE